ncbi:transposase [Planctomicrobium sp. SH664]|uniref:transposase n=1 Tax=Planctomicrobium sp. SH664 TaxID=3448125 RepID=UPI003F5BB0BE
MDRGQDGPAPVYFGFPMGSDPRSVRQSRPFASGRPPQNRSRACLEGVRWIRTSGAQWKLLPDWYPRPATCWRRLKDWTESGVLLQAWERLFLQLDRRQLIKWDQAMADAKFSPAKKR